MRAIAGDLVVLGVGLGRAATSTAGDGRLVGEALLHDSRDPVYRAPAGAVPVGTRVRLRLRTLAGDAASATIVTWNEMSGARALHAMALVAGTREGGRGFDLSEATLRAETAPGLVGYRFVVSTPDPGEARVHVAGGFQGWVAGTTPMTPAGAGSWTYTLEAREGERLDYKYTLGTWDRIEKGADLAEIPPRSIVVAVDGAQTVSDRVLRWRDTDLCARPR